jgi:uncharacterized membrane protein
VAVPVPERQHLQQESEWAFLAAVLMVVVFVVGVRVSVAVIMALVSAVSVVVSGIVGGVCGVRSVVVARCSVVMLAVQS